jgi:hypothetical protein
MPLTRIRTSSILDREVREQDLADGAVSFDKINVSAPALPGYVLTTDGLGNLVWNSPTGAVISLDTIVDVDVSTIPPTIDQVLAFDGVDTWRPLSIPGLGSSSNTFMANTIDDLPTTPNEGDMGFVRSGVDGEYKFYVKDTITTDATLLTFNGSTITRSGGVSDFITEGFTNKQIIRITNTASNNGNYTITDVTATTITVAQSFTPEGPLGATLTGSWILLATEDSARTDANTQEAIVFWNTGSPVLIGNISQNSRVTTVTVDVTTAFNDPTSTLTVGDAGDNSRLLSNEFIDLSEIGTYVINVDYIYTSPTDTDILTYFNFGTSTQGVARVVVTHV